ncbi:MAG: hypothetical protein P8X87_06870 [Candidatus Bathyarchaeota archaeon]
MNKKILGVLVCLFTLALLTIPVLGVPATKIEGVTFTGENIERVTSSVRTFGNIRISKGTTTGDVYLTIPTIGTLEGDWHSEPVAKTTFTAPATDPPATDPDAKVAIRGKVVWTFSGEGTTGTFEGVLHQYYIGYPPVYGVFSSYQYTRMVLQGTGDFRGQTLKLSWEGPTPDGYLIMPK